MEQAVSSPEVESVTDTPSATDNEAPASVGKFANSDELLKAYTHLEAEFTKKCQQLKESERRCETSEPSEKEGSAPLYEREGWEERVSDFLGKYPIAEEYAEQISSILKEEPDLSREENCLEIALGRALAKNYKKPESIMEDEAFLEKYVYQNASGYELFTDKWLTTTELLAKIPVERAELETRLKAKNQIEVADTLKTYLLQVEDKHLRGEQMPMEYARPQIEKMVLSARQVEFLTKERERLYNEAIQNQKIHFYE